MASETPWLDDDCTVSAPVTPWSALTTGWVTWVSTMSGEAPGYGVITMTAGIDMLAGGVEAGAKHEHDAEHHDGTEVQGQTGYEGHGPLTMPER